MSLQKEIKRSRPFEVPEEEAFLNLVRTCQQLASESEQLLKEHGISEAQYNVLRILRGAGKAGLPSLEIGRRMVTRVPDVTRLIDRLEAAGFAERRRCEADRRVTYVIVTPAGEKVVGALDKPMVDLHKRQLGHLTRTELAEFNRLLVKVRRPGED